MKIPATCDFIHEGGQPVATHHLYAEERFFNACADHAHRHGMAFPRVRELATGIEITTRTVGTDQLAKGDVLHLRGIARLVLDREIPVHIPGRGEIETLYLSSARIDNWDDVVQLATKYPATEAAWIVKHASQVGDEHRWTIHGGVSTRWTREVRTQH